MKTHGIGLILLMQVLLFHDLVAFADETQVTSTSSIPAELQGIHPIQVPEYKGVEQILVLSDRWVIVVSNKMQALFKEIDKQSGGELSKSVDSWKTSEANGRPNWNAYRARWTIRDKYIAMAREAIGERKLGDPAFFSITSPDDISYRTSGRPSRADRLYVSAGQGGATGGVFSIDYFIYSYLELPTPMLEGKTYIFTLASGASASLKFDRKATISRAIKINQLGYLPDAGQKRAYLGAYLYRFGPLDLSHVKKFEVINAKTGQVALEGEIKLIEVNPRFAPKDTSQNQSTRPLMYGENVYLADFSKLNEEGIFFISVPGVGRSWPFRHAASVYGEAFYTTTRGLYHQRAGIPITAQYSFWTRQKAARGPYCESGHIAFPLHSGEPKGYNRFDVIGATLDCRAPVNEVPGGWHDAADWDSNHAHYTVVFDLLNAYALNPERFTDNQLNLPESGNGVPDLLDEARFGLEIWRLSMDKNGGVSGMLEASTHTNIKGEVNGRKYPYAFSKRTRWSSLIFAAAAAQYAQLVKPFNATDSALYADAALAAYKFGSNPANSLGSTDIQAKTDRGQAKPYSIPWTETDEHIRPYLLHAKLRLYLLTGENSYLEGVGQLADSSKKPFEWNFTRKDFSPWIYYSLIEAGDALPKLLVMRWRKWFIDDAENLLKLLHETPYATTWPRKQDYWLAWGASNVSNFNRSLFIAHKLTGRKSYRNAAILNADFMLGANPMGMSWTTGLGFVYPTDIQHEVSEKDNIDDPVPGITIYGIDGGPIYAKFREKVWQSPSAEGKIDFVSDETQRDPPLWRRWMMHPHENVGQNEFTIWESMSSTIFTMAMLNADHWMPGKSELKRKPRDPRHLFGRWYLP